MCAITKKEWLIVIASLCFGVGFGTGAFALALVLMMRATQCTFTYGGGLICPDSNGPFVIWLTAGFMSAIVAIFAFTAAFVPLNACNDEGEEDETTEDGTPQLPPPPQSVEKTT